MTLLLLSTTLGGPVAVVSVLLRSEAISSPGPLWGWFVAVLLCWACGHHLPTWSRRQRPELSTIVVR